MQRYRIWLYLSDNLACDVASFGKSTLNYSMTRIKLIIVLSISFFFNVNVFSQKGDYKIMRDTLTKLSCKAFDSLVIVQSISELTSIDTNLLDQNEDLYYRDLGWGYYRLYLYIKDTALIRKSIECYNKAKYHKPNDSSTFWELAHLHYILEDCETGKYYLDQFKKITEKQFWREDQIKLITKRCDN